jgi:hypothetical protein
LVIGNDIKIWSTIAREITPRSHRRVIKIFLLCCQGLGTLTHCKMKI